MGAVMEIFVALALLFGAGNYALRELHHEVRSATVRKVKEGLPSLAAYTEKMTGWHTRGNR